MLRPAVILCAVIGLFAARQMRAGELDAVRESVTAPSPSQPSSHDHSDDDDDDDSFFDEFFAPLVWHALISPWSLPINLLDDPYTDYAGIVPQPYRDEAFALRYQAGREGPLPEVFGRLQLDYSTTFDGLMQVGGQLLVETPWRIGIDTSLAHWWEDGGGATESLELGDANLVYRFAQSETMQFRTGIGVNWIAGYADGDVGFNFTYGFDWFPRKPWTISSNFDIGTLGHAGMFHNQTTVGVVVKSFEIFTGYDYRRIGGGELDGWITGLRWRF